MFHKYFFHLHPITRSSHHRGPHLPCFFQLLSVGPLQSVSASRSQACEHGQECLCRNVLGPTGLTDGVIS